MYVHLCFEIGINFFLYIQLFKCHLLTSLSPVIHIKHLKFPCVQIHFWALYSVLPVCLSKSNPTSHLLQLPTNFLLSTLKSNHFILNLLKGVLVFLALYSFTEFQDVLRFQKFAETLVGITLNLQLKAELVLNISKQNGKVQ